MVPLALCAAIPVLTGCTASEADMRVTTYRTLDYHPADAVGGDPTERRDGDNGGDANVGGDAIAGGDANAGGDAAVGGDPAPSDGDSGPSCGICNDDNPCTLDRCAGTVCEHEPIDDDVLECTDALHLARCDDGVLNQLLCPAACLSAGFNAFAACDESGLACPCGTVAGSACVPGVYGCVGSTLFLGECVAAETVGTSENVWQAQHCDDICSSLDLGRAVMCGPDYQSGGDVCYCGSGCEPPCPDGFSCLDGSCYAETDPGTCSSDWDCGDRMRCYGGECVVVECTYDGHCGWCQRCYGDTCTSCATEFDGSCSCY